MSVTSVKPPQVEDEERKQLKSFSKGLFSGQIHEDIVFPYPRLSKEDEETLEEIIAAFHRFADQHIDPVKIDREAHLPAEVVKGLAELGLFGLTVPEEYGGFGLSQTMYSRIIGEVAPRDASSGVTIGAHLSIGLKGIVLFGTEEQKRKYLPRLASGEQLAAFALTEPSSGSDAASIQSTAVLSPDGTHYLLNGGKIWITNGAIADVFTTFAKTEVEEKGEKKQKITAFIVTRDMQGFSHGKEEGKLGIKGSSTTSIYFDNVRVPVENVLGPVGRGFKVAMEVLNSGRLGLGAGAVGAAKEVLKHTVAHARNRVQFKRPIAEWEIIAGKIAQMTIDTFVGESMVFLTTALVDRGDTDYSLESAICKVYCSEMLWRVVNECLQISAGNGYMTEYPYERYLRDSRINMIFEGTNEILRVFIALAGMAGPGEYLRQVGKALADPVKAFGLISDYGVKWITRTFTTERLTKAHPRLSYSVDHFERYTKEFAGIIERTLMKYGKDMVEREFIQARVADVTIDLYGLVATLSRVSRLIEERGEATCKTEIQICEAFTEDAWRRIRRNLRMISDNHDKLLWEIAHDVYERDGYKF